MDTGTRLSLTLTLLLTAVAFKLVIAGSLPQLSYMTILDQYMWMSLLFICLVAIENAIFPVFVSRYGSQHSNNEKWILLSMSVFFVLLNASYGISQFRRLHLRNLTNQSLKETALESRKKNKITTSTKNN